MSSVVHIDGYQQMMMANDLFLLFKEGKKRVTCRRGHRDIQLDDLVFISTDPVYICQIETAPYETYCTRCGDTHICQLVHVTEVRHKRVKDVTDEEAQLDGFKDAEDLFVGMKRFYPTLKKNDELTFIFFDVR